MGSQPTGALTEGGESLDEPEKAQDGWLGNGQRGHEVGVLVAVGTVPETEDLPLIVDTGCREQEPGGVRRNQVVEVVQTAVVAIYGGFRKACAPSVGKKVARGLPAVRFLNNIVWTRKGMIAGRIIGDDVEGGWVAERIPPDDPDGKSGRLVIVPAILGGFPGSGPLIFLE